MADVNLSTICDAIETTLAAATGLVRTQSYDELTEGIHDWPMLQVYPESGELDPSGRTDRTTFGAGVQQDRTIIHADLYVRQRAHIGEDMSALVNMIDAIKQVLRHEGADTLFGVANLQSIHWRWERVVFIYGDPELKYVGARFYIEVLTF
jgi:hypothetical protein